MDLSDEALARRFNTTPGAIICTTVLLCATALVGIVTLILFYVLS